MTQFSIFDDASGSLLTQGNDGNQALAIGNLFYWNGSGTISCRGMRVFNPHPFGSTGVTFTAQPAYTNGPSADWNPVGPPNDALIRQVGNVDLPPGVWTTVTWAPFDLQPGVPIWLSYSCPSGDYGYEAGATIGNPAVKAVGGQPLYLAASPETPPSGVLRDRASFIYNEIDLTNAGSASGAYWAGVDLLAEDTPHLTGSADFSGSGGLTAGSVSAGTRAAVSLSGTGQLALGGASPQASAGVALSGSGTLTTLRGSAINLYLWDGTSERLLTELALWTGTALVPITLDSQLSG